VSNKYYGKYRGIVVDNDDSHYGDNELRGRILVQVPSIFHAQHDVLVAAQNIATEQGVTASDEHIKENTPSVWAEPCFPYGGDFVGFNFIPPVGALVWVEFEAGDLNYPIWVGVWTTPSAGVGNIPPEHTGPDKKTIRTDAHWMEFVDTDGAEIFHYKHMVSGIEITLDWKGDATVVVTNDQIINITRDDKQTIGRDKITQITRNRTDNIGKLWNVTTGDKVTEQYGGDWAVTITGNVTITPTGFVKLVAPANQLIHLGAAPDGKVVTTISIDPFTGSPHPMGAEFVLAKNFT
jgi:uncharacterized protein involved in type VI secretion and phage assembly